MNIASNVTLVRVSMVWLLAVAMALVLVVSNRPGDGAVHNERRGGPTSGFQLCHASSCSCISPFAMR